MEGDAAKTRIISHMNKGHTRELSHYLRHYVGLSPGAASSPTMRDVGLDGMVITANGKDYSIPFAPRLSGWAEAKTRIIEMDAIARDHLGISDLYISEYAGPAGSDFIVIFGVVTVTLLTAASPWIVPGSHAWVVLDAYIPGGAPRFVTFIKAIFGFMFGVHLVEGYFFDRKLQRHGVDRWSKLWWTWEHGCFWEGMFCVQRLDRLVAAKAAEKEGKKA